ncbi:hypothetical protein HY041_00875 [Candidatus Roizmanbacteria bacterium]|nr:hypothetical protein [Candidatus Roizmanbacteria bacterium]
MITIPEVVEEIILDSLFLEEALSEGIINYSALARKIKSQVEKRLLRKVQNGAILLKSLAWMGINVIEVVSSYTELTIVLENKDVDRAFSVLKRTSVS